MLLYVLVVCLILICIFTLIVGYSLDNKKVYSDLKEKHVVVTGGSSGIGKAVAIEAAKLRAHVTIIGRDIERLKSTVEEILKHTLSNEQRIQFAPLDVTSNYEVIKKTLSDVEAKVGPIFMLINCAGMCKCAEFDKADVDDIKQMIDLNYFGTAYPTRYVLPGMKKRNEGLIVFVSTEAALIGIYGYSAYGAAKWAVRGLAESVFMELIGTNVRLTLAFPPDTDTPGFAQEELTKPVETKLISGSGGLHSPEEVGKKLIMDSLTGKSYSVFGMSGKILSLLNCGSLESKTQVFLQIISMGFLRTIMVAILLSFHKIVRDNLKEKRKAQKSELHSELNSAYFGYRLMISDEPKKNINCYNCSAIQRSESIRYLGVILDHQMTFRQHTTETSKRVRKLMAVMRNLRDVVDVSEFCNDTMIKIILLPCILAAVQAAGLLGPAGLYGPPVAYPGYNNYPAQPAIASQQANIYRSPFNLGQVSTYSKAIDTPFSSVRKADIRVSNPGLALAPSAYHGLAAPVLSHITAPAKVVSGVLGVAYSAAPAVSHMTYTNGLGYSYGW
ncbi:3-ketodihydrosphingosine reductase [Aricia agestis]|uniref:3-ketodihydrosphingosine reductase n=1 Tax=Aricia agestis TaxID=91739 RepID=UPI001C203561|nr:3-ketodihydrosphingosine reductase [Aricia agestis]